MTTIDPPTWVGLLTALLRVLERDIRDEVDGVVFGGPRGAAKVDLREQLARMAKAADSYNRLVKERNIDSLTAANNELTDLASRLDDASSDEDIPAAHRESIEQAKWDVESAMALTDPSGLSAAIQEAISEEES